MKKYIAKLTKDERKNLVYSIKVGKSSAKKLMHARVLLEKKHCMIFAFLKRLFTAYYLTHLNVRLR